MNIQNYEYLRDQLFFTGFGNHLEEALKSKIAKGKQEFQLQFKTQFDADPIRAELHFSKSKQTDMYFFNSYRLELPQKVDRQASARKFYMNGKDRFTLKEAYNLLNGRSVHKQVSNNQGEPYRAWFQLDFKTLDMHGNQKMLQYHENYGYDLEKQLQRFPIVELQDPDSKKNLLDSLGRGNRQLVTFELATGKERLYLEALPRFKAVCIYNEQGIRQEFIDDRQQQQHKPNATLQEQQRQTQVKKQGLIGGGSSRL